MQRPATISQYGCGRRPEQCVRSPADDNRHGCLRTHVRWRGPPSLVGTDLERIGVPVRPRAGCRRRHHRRFHGGCDVWVSHHYSPCPCSRWTTSALPGCAIGSSASG